MANTIKIRRGFKNGLTTLQGAGQLVEGEPYLIRGDTGVNNAQARLAIGLDASNYIIVAREDLTQPLDADLTAIAALSGTSGFLKKDSANTWSLDTNSYLTGESDTLSTVTGRGATTTTATTFSGGITVNNTGTNNGIIFRGQTSGTATVTAPLIAGTTALTLPASGGTLARVEDIGTAGLTLSVSGASNSGTAIGIGTGTGFTANTSGSAVTYNITIGPAISALATLMNTGGVGFIKRGATADSFTIDTATYTTTATTVNSFASATGNLSLGNGSTNYKIVNLADPNDPNDAANKAYVDSVAQGLDIKASVRLATAASISSLSGAQTIDGTAVVTGDRILVKNHTTSSQNGIWIANTGGAWTRAADANTWVELISAFTFVEEGTQNADTSWVSTVNAGGALDTTAITFVQFGAAGTVTAGAGLTSTGNTLDVGAGTGITVNANDIQISDNYAGQASIVTVGSITSGTWNANTIAVNRGGTGVATLTGLVKGNGTSAFTAAVDGTDYLSPNATIDGGTF